jgi:8-oxo-dGTP diphosphatase
MAAGVPCAGAIVFDEAGRLLLIRRGRPPSAGLWSIPGGRCWPGESAAEACVREAHEETGLSVRVVRFAGRVQRPGPDASSYDIDDFVCTVLGGSLEAGDDAVDARWVGRDELSGMELVPGLLDALQEWDALPT